MDNINNNNNNNNNNQNNVNAYNSIQTPSGLVDDANVTEPNNVVDELSGMPPVAPSNAPVEEFLSEQTDNQNVQSQIQDASAIQQIPSFENTPLNEESVTQSPVSDTPSLVQESVQSSIPEKQPEVSVDMSASLSKPISTASESLNPVEQPVPSFEPANQQSQATLSENEFLQPSIETPSVPAFNESEIVNTLGNEESKKKGGNAIVIVLIIVIIALLIAIGYFAYKVFFA